VTAPPPRPSVARTPASPGSTTPAGVRSSPLARKRAAELGVDLGTITGTGPDGAVTVADVEAAAGELPTTKPPPTPAPAAAAPAGRTADDRSAAVRAATGRLMARSKREIPHYYLSATFDLRDALDWLEQTNRDRPITERVLPAALLLRAVVVTLRRPTPPQRLVDRRRAASRRPGRPRCGHRAARRRPDRPRDPGGRPARPRRHHGRAAQHRGRARSGRLKGTDLGEASITVTNLGDQGVDSVYGVIAPPQVAVVGFGAVLERPWAIGGMLTVRPVVTATLSADHRATDGHEGARFLAALDHLLHEPETL
jgi:pyruvate dehydrogenase E2 component (dihydrolipoamide acetyltransferase)